MGNNDQNDKELNDYLNGNSDISKTYSLSNSVEPTNALDEIILSAANKEIDKNLTEVPSRFRKSTWTLPVSIAAMITLSVSLVMTMQQETGQELISEPKTQMFETMELIQESETIKEVDRSDVATSISSGIRQDKDETIEMDSPAPAALGTVADNYRTDQKAEVSKTRKREMPVKKILTKEKVQFEVLEERVFSDDAMLQSVPAEMKLDSVTTLKREIKAVNSDAELLEIKTMWQQGEFKNAKQTYDSFIENNPDITSARIKEILGSTVYNQIISS